MLTTTQILTELRAIDDGPFRLALDQSVYGLTPIRLAATEFQDRGLQLLDQAGRISVVATPSIGEDSRSLLGAFVNRLIELAGPS